METTDIVEQTGSVRSVEDARETVHWFNPYPKCDGSVFEVWRDMWAEFCEMDGMRMTVWDVPAALDVPGTPAAVVEACAGRGSNGLSESVIARLNVLRAFGGAVVPTHSEPVRSLRPLMAADKFVTAFNGPFAQVEWRFMVSPVHSGAPLSIMAFMATDARDRNRPFDPDRSFTNAIEYCPVDRVVLPFSSVRPQFSEMYSQSNYLITHE